MEQQKKRYFHDDQGNLSAMRFMCFIAEMTAIAITVFVFWRNDKQLFDSSFPWLLAWLIMAFAGKGTQKLIELLPMIKSGAPVKDIVRAAFGGVKVPQQEDKEDHPPVPSNREP